MNVLMPLNAPNAALAILFHKMVVNVKLNAVILVPPVIVQILINA